MRVGMDLLDAYAEKGKGSYLRCGPADVEPVISDDGGAQFDSRTVVGHRGKRFQIDSIQQLPMQRELQRLIFGRIGLRIKQPADPSANLYIVPKWTGP